MRLMEINAETTFVTVSVILFLVGMIFVMIGIYAYQRKSPMYFYAGSDINSSEITDVKAYNKANGIMWMAYGALYFIPILVYILIPDKISETVLSISVVICFLGLLAVLWICQKIDDKYRIQ